MAPDEYPAVGEYSHRQLLEMEKEMTGVYVSGHPLDEYREQLEKFSYNTAWVQELKERPDGGLNDDGTTVTMGGIIAASRPKATKKGDLMGFITLEDLTGQIECLVVPRVWERYHNILAEDSSVILRGHLSVREDEDTKLLVDSAEPLQISSPALPEPEPLTDAERARRAPVKLYLRMRREQLHDVQQILQQQPGGVPVYINLPAEGITLLAPAECWCADPNAAQKTLGVLLPMTDMRIVDKRREVGTP